MVCKNIIKLCLLLAFYLGVIVHSDANLLPKSFDSESTFSDCTTTLSNKIIVILKPLFDFSQKINTRQVESSPSQISNTKAYDSIEPTHKIAARPNDFAYPGDMGQITEFSTYMTSVAQASKRIKENGINIDTVSRLFYPLIGTDVAAPFVLFPKLKALLAIERLPFFSTNPFKMKFNQPFTVMPPIGGAWRSETHLTSESFLSPRIFGALFYAFPNLTIDRLKIIRSLNPSFANNETYKPYLISIVIEFRTHASGERKTITIVSAAIDPYQFELKSKFANILRAFAPEAMLLKGSWNLFSQFSINERRFLLNLLAANHGILLEDPDRHHFDRVKSGLIYGGEIGFDEFVDYPSAIHQFRSSPSLVLDEIGLGYGNKLIVTDLRDYHSPWWEHFLLK